MKILIVANNSGGLYHFRIELIQQFLDKGYEVYICLPNGEFVSEMQKLGCTFLKSMV